MSKGKSGLFLGTKGFRMSLKEDVIDRFMPSGEININFNKLPGEKDVQIPKRLTDKQMEFLTM